MNKKSTIPISILIVIIISIVVTIVIMNNKKPDKNPSLSPETNQSINNEETTMHKVYIDIDSKKLEIDLEDNSTTSALVKMLPTALSMSDLNGNEKYAYLDKSLLTNTYSPERIEAGDVMLFGDNCLVIFYESLDTSYSYSKIGHINNLPELGSESISVKLSPE